MGAYLSSPVTDKISSDKACTEFTYGASSMQGWRISQEDAHNCLPDFDSDKSTSLFAVYDGHGGAEVAQYCALHLPNCIKETEQYKKGELGEGLVEAFLKFDAQLVEENVIKELKALAGEDENEEEEEDGDPVGHGEADVLRAEADLPLDELLAKYQTITGNASNKALRKREAFQSPVVRARSDGAGSSKADTDGEAAPCSSRDNAADASDNSDGPSPSSFRDRLTNGLADNENNLNKEKELQDSQKSESGEDKDCTGDPASVNCAKPSGSSNSSHGPVPTDSKDSGLCEGSNAGPSSSKDIADTSCSGATSSPCDASSSAPCGSSSGVSSNSSAGHSTCSSSSAADEPASKSDEQPIGSSSSEATDDADEAGPSGSGCGSSGAGGSGGGNAGCGLNNEVDMDDDSDDDDPDEEYEWQEDSEDEDDEEEDEEDDVEGMDGSEEPMMDMSNEEPGSDSGCTACVVLLHKNHLVVANAGDSRCVLCRNGKAVDLSFDHKPEDDPERTRIEKAGGKVTADGRVNGGLNLSRAIGDHFYKRKEELPPEEQMITALPDIKEMTVEAEDQFFVVACDGIWNYMSSQEVVDFVAERLKDLEKRNKPSSICEELFDHCLAPNTYGDGTGCDNMTCIIVVLNADGTACAAGDCMPPSKRSAGDDVSTENTEKRPRVEDSGSVSVADVNEGTASEKHTGD